MSRVRIPFPAPVFIKIGGVRGSGKTTVTPDFVSLLDSLGYQTERVYGAKLMADYLGTTVDGLDNCTESDRKRARVHVYTKLYAQDRMEPALRVRDGHFALVHRTPPGLEVNVSDLIPEDHQQLRAIYVLQPPEEIILTRRVLDTNLRGDRNLADRDLLCHELYWEQKVAREQADKLGLTTHFFDNLGTPRETSQQMLRQLQNDLGSELCSYARSRVEG